MTIACAGTLSLQIQTELLRDAGLQSINREVHAARVLLAHHHEQLGELPARERDAAARWDALSARTAALETRVGERLSVTANTQHALHELQRHKADKFEIEQLRAFVLQSSQRPRTAKHGGGGGGGGGVSVDIDDADRATRAAFSDSNACVFVCARMAVCLFQLQRSREFRATLSLSPSLSLAV